MGLFQGRRDTDSVTQDLLDNDHQCCKVCGDLYYSINPKQVYCSRACRINFHNSLRRRK